MGSRGVGVRLQGAGEPCPHGDPSRSALAWKLQPTELLLCSDQWNRRTSALCDRKGVGAGTELREGL